MLAHVRPVAAEEVEPPRRRAGCSPNRGRRSSTCRRSTARRWTGSPFAPRTRRGGCGVSDSRAGRPWPGTLGAGEAVAISTGAVVPPGTTRRAGRGGAPRPVTVAVPQGAEGAHVRRRGGDAGRGSVVLPGRRLRRGADRCAGRRRNHASQRCARRPHVAVLATGSELRGPGVPLGPGEIYEANTPLLRRQLESAGAEVEVLAPVADDVGGDAPLSPTGLRATCWSRRAASRSARTTSYAPALAELGVEEVFWRVALRPGRPIAFGVRGRTLVFGLPGNPVSSLVGFELFVRPAVLALQQAGEPGPVVPRRRSGRAGGGHPSAPNWLGPGSGSTTGGRAGTARRAGVAHDRASAAGRRARPDRARRR